jgi:hypothetical protein
MGLPSAFRNTTETSSGVREYDEQSTLAVIINLLLLLLALVVVSLLCYIIRYIMLKIQPLEEFEKAGSNDEDRADFIKENLRVNAWVEGTQSEDEEKAGQEGSLKRDLSEPSFKSHDLNSQGQTKVSDEGNGDISEYSNRSLDSFDGCAICLANYRRHQKVCESSNPACTHIFHEECMVNWLMKHHTCPICGQIYIITKSPPKCPG